MSDSYWDAFFTLHNDLPREGPGEPADVAWATQLAGVPADARICDAACGPGADIAALLAAAPDGHVIALDTAEGFVKQAQAAHGSDPRTTIFAGDMAAVTGPFDLIWCAGAVYFLGVRQALETWKNALAPGGAVAFSQVCWFTDAPSQAAREGWAEYADMTDEPGVLSAIDAAGYDVLGTRRLSDAAWEAYYEPMDARIAQLTPEAGPALAAVLQEGRDEAALWRNHRTEFGYTLFVVRPR
ncbi:class I SAM-dependent methyltransferase [Roseobacter sp. S98]|uniref:class I SAM-dependent methyltransferase n=1 Tax=Roseobacter algicola (ex Choi et al. 2025) (nom. illeg.) TaxID=3092138 RepID=UPI0035C6CB3E